MSEKFNIFNNFVQNIDCGYILEPPRQGSSNKYPQSMFWIKNKKNRYTPVKPSFTIYKWRLRGYTFHRHVFLMDVSLARLHEVHRAIVVTSVVCVPVHVTLAIFFSRSSYLDSHSSESIHTWTYHTL